MSTISTLGPVGYNPTGDYDATKTYEKLDVVVYQGSSYVAISDSIGQLPTNTTYWELIAKKGDTGDTGATGNGVVGISKTSTVGLVDTYTMSYTNGNSDTFTVTNGEDGEVTQGQLDAVQAELDYNELVENALPKVTGSGSTSTLNDTAESPLKLILEPSELSQASVPTPSSPQDIHTVNGNNTITIQNKNICISSSKISNAIIAFQLTKAIKKTFTLSFTTNETLTGNSLYFVIDGENRTIYQNLTGSGRISQTVTISDEIYDEIQEATTFDLRIYKNNGNFNAPIDAQIENTNQVSNYVQHQEQSLSLNLGTIEYCKIGDYADEFYKATSSDQYMQSGKWYQKEKIGNVYLDSLVSWTVRNLTDTNLYFTTSEYDLDINPSGTGLSTHFPYVSDLSTNDTPGFNFESETGHLRIRIPKTLLSNVSTQENAITSFQNWFSSNDVMIYFVRNSVRNVLLPSTPEQLNIQAALNTIYETAIAYQGQTNISQTNADLPFVIKSETFMEISSSDVSRWDNKQDALVSGTNIKTVTNKSLLGSGNVSIDYSDIDNTPSIPTKISDLTNDNNTVTDENYVHTDNNYTNDEKTKLSGLENYDDTAIANELKRAEMVYNALPKVTSSGTNITLDDTAECPMELELEPSELSQQTTTGKNKIKLTVSTGSLGNNVSVTKNSDGTLKVNGTANENIFAKIGEASVTAGTQYFLSGCPSGGGSSSYRLYITGNSSAYDSGNGSAYQPTSTGTINIYIAIYSGTTVNNLIYKPQLELGSAGTSFEEPTNGQPSPNPDYPQDVHIIIGDNEIKVGNVNIWDEQWELGSLDADTGEETSSTAIIRTKNYIQVRPNTTYYCYTGKIIGQGSASIPIYCYDKNKNYLGSSARISVNNTTFTTASNCYFIKWRTGSEYGTTYLNDICINVSNASINGTYYAHQEQSLPLTLGDLEYCKIGDYADMFYKATSSDTSLQEGKWYLKKNIDKTTLNGSEAWNTLSYAYYTSKLNDVIKNVSSSDQNKYLINTHFPSVSAYQAGTQGLNGMYTVNEQVYLRGYSSTFVDAQALKTWLSTNNVDVYFVLATPTYTLLNNTLQTELDNIYEWTKSYQDQTNISQTNAELPFIINAKAIYDLSKLVTRVDLLESEV